MLQKVIHGLKGDAVVARDGSVGKVDDVYFDDERWAVRYLVVDTGNWLPGRHVLISPASVSPGGADGADSISLDLTRHQVEHAPGTDADPPVSRRFEEAHARYYGYPYYWAGPYLWGVAEMPLATPAIEQSRADAAKRGEDLERAEHEAEASHLRSGAEVIGYRVHAADGEIGHIQDFLIDDENWAIADMVVDTRNWLPGRKVLVSPAAVKEIDWRNREVAVRLTREELKRAPAAP